MAEPDHSDPRPGPLARLRGTLPARNHDARTVAALAANPGCARRGVLDAAGIDKARLAGRLGFAAAPGASPFAIARGNAFEAQVKADDCAQLRELLAALLGVEPTGGVHGDAGTGPREDRVARTRELLARVWADASGGCAVVDHPMLALDVAGHPAYLEPDAMACKVAGRLHVVEIKSFAIVDGRADPGKLAAATQQSAVYVHALRGLAADLGLGEDAVSADVVLICPQDFSNRPTAVLVDVRRQLAVVRRRLARTARVDELVASLPPGLTFDTGEGGVEAARGAVARVPAAYVPGCLNSCELGRFCRDEARGPGGTCSGAGARPALAGALGADVRGALGGLDDLADALALAEGRRLPRPGEEEIARVLRRAEELRREVLDEVTRPLTAV